LPKPSYTSVTLAYLQEKHPAHQFSIIMGSDSFQNIERWNNYQSIIENYQIIIYQRPGFEIRNKALARMDIMKAPLLDISATHIREIIKAGKSIRYLVPENVENEIEKSRFFKS
jgi:nicotinate-nucleotide adenylyltransferase